MKKHSFCLLLFLFASFQSLSQLKEVLSLDDCVRLVVGRSNDLKKSKLDIQKTNIYFQQVQTSIFPSLNLAFSPNFNLGRSIDPYTNQFVERNVFASNIGISSNIMVFNGLQQQYAIEQTNINHKISELSYHLAKNKLISDVYQAYLRVLLAKEYIRIGEKQLKLLNEQKEIIKAQIAAGILTDLDLLNIETQMNLDDINLLNNKNNLQIALIALKQLLNLPNFSQIDVQLIDIDKATKKNTTIKNRGHILSEFVMKNPNLKIANLKLELSNRNIEQLKYLKYPTVGLSVGLNSTYSNVAYGAFTFLDQLWFNKYFFVGINLRVPIFNGNQVKYKLLLSEIDKKMLELDNKNLTMQLQYNVELIIENGILLKRKQSILSQKYESMIAIFRAMSENFKMGYATSNDYLSAKNALEKVESELIQNRLEIFFNEKMIDLLINPVTDHLE